MKNLKNRLRSVYFRFHVLYLECFTKIKPQDVHTIKSQKTPLLLVAGIYNSAKVLLPMKRYFEAQGYPVYLQSDKRNTETIPALAKKLQKIIQKIPGKRVQIIAHSMGGLVALVALQNPVIAKKVAKVITLGTPFAGCLTGSVAFWELHNNRPYLQYHSKAIKVFQRDKSILSKFETIHTDSDWIVFPSRNTTLSEARSNTCVNVIGHVSLLFHPQVLRLIKRKLLP